MTVIAREIVCYWETGGTATIVEADDLGLVAETPEWSVEGANVVRAEAITGYQGAAGIVPTTRYQSIGLVTEWYAPVLTSLSTWQAWQQYDLLLAVPCGIATDFSADTVTITPPNGLVSGRGGGGNYDACTIEMRERGGNTYRATNCIGVLESISGESGERILLTWRFLGDYVQPTTTASYTPPAAPSVIPSVTRAITVTITPDGGSALTLPCQTRFVFTTGLQIEPRACIGNANSFGGGVVSIDPEGATLELGIIVDTEAVTPWWDYWTDGRACEITISWTDGVTVATLTLPAAQLVAAPTREAVAGELVYTLQWVLCQDGTSGPWSLGLAAVTPA